MLRLYTFITYSTTILTLLVFSKISACEVDFTYDNSSTDGAVTFQAHTYYTNAPYFSWNLGDGQFSHQRNYTHTYSFSGDYLVCLTVNDNNNCSNTTCETISVTNQNGNNCTLNECVYPGDTDRDGSADIYDLFSIGMHYGTTGPPRPNAHEGWQSQPSQDWAYSCINGNLKHTDCNGDGVIDSDDLLPILNNYDNSHSYNNPTPNTNINLPVIHLEFNSDSIVINDNNPGLVDVSLDVIVGSAAVPINNLYSLAFSLNFLSDLIDPESITVEYDDQSFFCHPANLIHLSKITEDGRVDLGFSRTSKTPISGHGRIARVNFTIIGDLVVSRNPGNDELPLEVETQNAIGINQFGTNLGLTTLGDALTFKINNSTSLRGSINHNLFQLSPNPSTGLVRVETGDHKVNDIKVYNTTGKLLRQQKVVQNNIEELDLSEFPNGTYLIKVSNDEESAIKRIIISK